MISNFKEKLENGRIELCFNETGTISVLETKFDENTGVEILKPTQETSSTHIADLIADLKERVDPYMRQIADLTDMAEAVAGKEAERDAAAKKAEGKK